jgi:hypothetical protein
LNEAGFNRAVVATQHDNPTGLPVEEMQREGFAGGDCVVYQGEPVAYLNPSLEELIEAWEARAQWKGKPLAGDIEVSITLYIGTKRKDDLDNFNKLSLDALQVLSMRTIPR